MACESRLVVVALVAAQALAARPATQQKPVTVEDLMRVRTIVDVRLSPDGAHVAYVVSTPSLERNAHEGALYVVPSRGGAALRLAEGTKIFNTPLVAPKLRWSPDGATVSFLGLADARAQVFGVSRGGGGARALTHAPEGVLTYEWSPDGASLAFVTRDRVPPEEARARQENAFFTRVDVPERPTRLVVQRLGLPSDNDLDSERLLTPSTQYVDNLSWSPDGREIAYSASSRSGFLAPYYARIYAASLASLASRTIVDRAGMNVGPKYSPDGRQIAFISTDGRAEMMAARGLAVVDARGGAPRLLSPRAAWVNEYIWAADSQSIYYQSYDGEFASAAMFEQPVMRVAVEDRRLERITSGAQVNYSLSLSRDGTHLAYRSVEGRTTGDLVLMDAATRRAETLTNVNHELDLMALGKLAPIAWRSFDGKQIFGLLLTPPGWSPGRRLPLVVYCHGGPIGGVTYGLFPQFAHTTGQVDPYPTEALAAAGFAVLFPMPRGGSGYGEEGWRAIVNAWGEGDYRDIMAGVDALVARGIADPDRLGVMGASYGGFMTNWIVTQTGRFKAASAGASISDLTDLYYLSDGGDVIAEYFKRPWEARESYAAHSPITFAERVTTPLLIQHGERDPRVPIAGAWKFYRALQALGKTVELDIYPRAGHLAYEPRMQREVMRRNLEWFLRWIKP